MLVPPVDCWMNHVDADGICESVSQKDIDVTALVNAELKKLNITYAYVIWIIPDAGLKDTRAYVTSQKGVEDTHLRTVVLFYKKLIYYLFGKLK